MFEQDNRPFTKPKEIRCQPPARNASSLRDSQPSRKNSSDVEGKKSSRRSSKNYDSRSSSRLERARSIVIPELDPNAYVHRKSTVGAFRSFLFGVFLGVLPLLIVVRLIWKCVTKESDRVWDARWLRYGKSFGLFLFIVFVIIIVAVLTT